MSKRFAPVVGLFLALSLTAPVLTAPVMAQQGADYAYYFDQGGAFYNKGDLTRAIDSYRKAIPLAPETSLPVVYNNLAAAFIKRGNYYQDTAKQPAGAMADFRQAIFYLDAGWPDGVDRKPLHERNLTAANGNLTNAYRLLRINPADKVAHVEMAKKLRQQGNFPEAIIEYLTVQKLDPKDADAARALGDLYNVMNLPFKSQKYYKLAGDTMGDSVSDDILVQQANAANKTGQVDQAVATYNKALEVNPNNVSALNQLQKIWENEIRFNPTNALGHANLGSVYQKQKKYDQAYQQYQAAEHFANQNPATPFDVKKRIRLNIGTLFQEQKRFDLANQAYDTVLQTDPNNVLALTYKASLYKDVGNTDGAVIAYTKILNNDPNNAIAQNALFDSIKAQTDPTKQAQSLKDYAERFPQNAVIQSQIGEYFHNKKDYDNAALYYQRALRIDPKLAATQANLGAVYQAQGKEKESVAAFKQALALDPNNTTVKNLLKDVESNNIIEAFNQAIQLQGQQKHAEALPYFEQGLAGADPKNPQTADMTASYGVSLQYLNRYDDAIRQYDRALALNPNSATYAYYKGTAYHQKQDFPKALAAYQQALRLDPNQNDAKTAIAQIQQQQSGDQLNKALAEYNASRFPQALTLLNQVLATDPKNAYAHYYKGLTYTAMKNKPAALASYKDATRVDPNFADAYYALGVALDEQRDALGAKAAFQKFVDLAPNKEDDLAKYAQTRLQQLSAAK